MLLLLFFIILKFLAPISKTQVTELRDEVLSFTFLSPCFRTRFALILSC